MSTAQGQLDLQSVPGVVFFRNTICSADEQVCRDLKLINPNRPVIEENTMLFKYFWKFRRFNSRYAALMVQQGYQWAAVLDDLSTTQNIKYRPVEPSQIDLDSSFGDDQLLQDYENIMNRVPGPPSNIPGVTPLIYRGAIETKSKQQAYSDIYYLVISGIPSEKRAQYWSDMLKVASLKEREQSIARRTYPRTYNTNLSVYQNFVEMAR